MCLCVHEHGRSEKSSVTADDEALSQIRKGHGTMCVMLMSRNKNLDIVRALWASGDIKVSVYYIHERTDPGFALKHCFTFQLSLNSATSMNDTSVVVDILNIINLKP